MDNRPSGVQLRCTRWPDGDSTVLAVCHAYGDWVEWRGLGGR